VRTLLATAVRTLLAIVVALVVLGAEWNLREPLIVQVPTALILVIDHVRAERRRRKTGAPCRTWEDR
jgi:hypothetical protein